MSKIQIKNTKNSLDFDNISVLKCQKINNSFIHTYKIVLKGQIKDSISGIFVRYAKNSDIVVDYQITQLDEDKGFITIDITDPQKSLFFELYEKQGQAKLIFKSKDVDNSTLMKSFEKVIPEFTITASLIKKASYRINISIDDVDNRFDKFLVKVKRKYNEERIDAYTAPTKNYLNISNGFCEFDVSCSNGENVEITATPITRYSKQAIGMSKTFNITGERPVPDFCLIYPVKISNSSIRVSVFVPSNNVLRVTLLRRDLTNNQQTYDSIKTNFMSAKVTTFIDETLVFGRVYEYSAILEFIDGTTRQTRATYVHKSENYKPEYSLKLSIASENVNDSQVTRKISADVTELIDNQSSNFVDELKSADQTSYANEIKKLTPNSKPLVMIQLTKVMLSTGVQEKVGIFKSGTTIQDKSDLSDVVYIGEILAKSSIDMMEEMGSIYTKTESTSQFQKSASVLSKNVTKTKNNFTQKFLSKNAIVNSTLKYGSSLNMRDVTIESGTTGIIDVIKSDAQQINSNIVLTHANKIDDDFVELKFKGQNLSMLNKMSIYALSDNNQGAYITDCICLDGINSVLIKSNQKKFYINSQVQNKTYNSNIKEVS